MAALVAADLDPCGAHVLRIAADDLPLDSIQPYRGWTDEDWAAPPDRLTARGLLDGDGRITPPGARLRADVEAATDRAAADLVDRIENVEAVIATFDALAARIGAAGDIPYPNPIGVPAPSCLGGVEPRHRRLDRGRRDVLAPDERAQLRGLERLGEQEPLDVADTEARERGELLRGLDAFGDDVELERPSHARDRLDEHAGAAVVGAQRLDEAAVDLQRVEREVLEVAERRVAGAEVVDRDVHADRAEPGRARRRRSRTRRTSADSVSSRHRRSGRSRSCGESLERRRATSRLELRRPRC